MLFQLQRYGNDLVYHPGTQLHLADTLSRALPTPSAECQQQNELEKELKIVSALDDAELEDITLHEIAKTTQSDLTSQSVKEFVQQGRPQEQRLLPKMRRQNNKDDLTFENGIIIKNSRCVIPKSL